jgi:hypothetical protein
MTDGSGRPIPLEGPVGGPVSNSAANPLPATFCSLKRARNSAAGRPAKIILKGLIYREFVASMGRNSGPGGSDFPVVRGRGTR